MQYWYVVSYISTHTHFFSLHMLVLILDETDFPKWWCIINISVMRVAIVLGYGKQQDNIYCYPSDGYH